MNGILGFLIGMLIGQVASCFRYGWTCLFAVATVVYSYLGDPLFILAALLFTCNFVSAWTQKPWTMVVWRMMRPNPIDRLSPAWKAAFERAREHDMRRNIK